MSAPDIDNPKLHCRMLEQKFPNEDDLCLVTVVSSSEMGTYVALKEYDDIQGMIPMSELSRKRYKQTRLTRVGKEEVATVIRVNSESGFIDLSLKRTTPEEKSAFLTKYTKNKEAHLIMRLIAKKADVSMEELYTMFGWPLAKKYGTLHDAFRKSLTEPDVFEPYGIPANILDALHQTISHYMTIQPLKFRADIEVSCFAIGGVESVKRALLKGVECAGDSGLVIKLVSSPLYVLFLTLPERQKGMEIMYAAVAAIKAQIESEGGSCVVKRDPCVVSKEEEIEENEDTTEDANSQDAEDE
ncbi:hypothetical protein ENUP19_0018G0029 [Entamoeba nuttalli]|uniref:Eukaryotic translation initiation factor 2 alpha subunit, putative n=2 Tax=Entamoeba nuttalli TaxID=412467 RepID=K2GWW9_ENTNP|nr:eukaryotic translation initiation factor 2 alpha subunit, putative [Entamoeba nuttalli P19]EKE38287.1 eukaryotic translation initiation factor 2 alpha subunit, putative [Entamoeba nuttalli P19]|eukprot:XP_008859379.1 eukaryotic translation initiation factor 2 alpha subunit, putative [Entamoeba nuttalli P19]